METRPKLKINPPPFDRKLELASVVLMLILWSLTLFVFLKLPATIPIHYNALGQVDGYGSKTSLLFLPSLATIVSLGLSWLNKYPHVFNYMTKITTENAERQYGIATRMLRVLKLSISTVFILITLFTYLTAVGITKGLGSWFLPLTFILFLIPTIISITKSLKAK